MKVAATVAGANRCSKASTSTAAAPAISAQRNAPPRRCGRWGKSVLMIDRCATRSEGTAAKACVREALAVTRWAPQWPQKLPAGTTDSQCGQFTKGGRSSGGAPAPPVSFMLTSLAAAFGVEDPRGVERRSIHAAPAGREIPAGAGVIGQVVSGRDVVERLGRKGGGVLAHPVKSRVGEACLVQPFLDQVLVDQRDRPRPERGGSRRPARLSLPAAADDMETGRRVGVG